MNVWSVAASWLVVALLPACAGSLPASVVVAPPGPVAAAPAPETASGWTPKPGWHARRRMVAAAHPLAADAGLQVLRDGGTALDAAVAVQMVLAVVEPQSSGIGGGALLLHADAGGERSVVAWDGRETAPAAADERLFVGADGNPLPYRDAVVGGRAVATPGVVAMLEAAHRAHGRLPWPRLFDAAIALADGGFPVGARLHGQLQADPALRRDPIAGALYYDADGRAVPVGTRLRNPALAAVLRAIAARGAAAMRDGPIADDIVARVRGDATAPGTLAAADLAGYAPRRRDAICTDWLDRWRVCGFPPPSSGHLATMQILRTLERLPVSPPRPCADGVPGADWLHAYAEAARLAFADRALYVADPDFVAAPAGDWSSLLDDGYLRGRAARIGPTAMPVAPPGRPPGAGVAAWAPMPAQPEHGTSHVSIVDDDGRAVSMTTTIEAAFGARLMSDGGSGLPGGFLLNNQMTDFAFTPRDAAGRPVANRIEPGKRPRSSMSPTLVFDRRDGRLAMTLGSPGGPAIIHFVAKTLLATRAWGHDVQHAIALPNFGGYGGPFVVEAGRFPAATVDALRARGHRVVENELTSGVQAIERSGDGWHGGADPRRDGEVRGD